MSKHAAPPSPREVIVAALAVALPCPSCGKAEVCRCIKPAGYSHVEERAKLVEAALLERGLLAGPTGELTRDDVEQMARWLADQSEHPRYWGEGWRRLLESEVDVDVAYTAASTRASQSALEELGRVRGFLRGYLAPRRASGAVTS